MSPTCSSRTPATRFSRRTPSRTREADSTSGSVAMFLREHWTAQRRRVAGANRWSDPSVRDQDADPVSEIALEGRDTEVSRVEAHHHDAVIRDRERPGTGLEASGPVQRNRRQPWLITSPRAKSPREQQLRSDRAALLPRRGAVDGGATRLHRARHFAGRVEKAGAIEQEHAQPPGATGPGTSPRCANRTDALRMLQDGERLVVDARDCAEVGRAARARSDLAVPPLTAMTTARGRRARSTRRPGPACRRPRSRS